MWTPHNTLPCAITLLVLTTIWKQLSFTSSLYDNSLFEWLPLAPPREWRKRDLFFNLIGRENQARINSKSTSIYCTGAGRTPKITQAISPRFCLLSEELIYRHYATAIKKRPMKLSSIRGQFCHFFFLPHVFFSLLPFSAINPLQRERQKFAQWMNGAAIKRCIPGKKWKRNRRLTLTHSLSSESMRRMRNTSAKMMTSLQKERIEKTYSQTRPTSNLPRLIRKILYYYGTEFCKHTPIFFLNQKSKFWLLRKWAISITDYPTSTVLLGVVAAVQQLPRKQS